MNHNPPEDPAAKILLRGVHLELTDALRAIASDKAGRLLRHHPSIVRIRLDLEFDQTRHVDHRFVAKGHIEIGGPDLLASVASEDGYKSLNLLMDKLDELLRRRRGMRESHRRETARLAGAPAE
jgi:putative sigma-54 modulation protein